MAFFVRGDALSCACFAPSGLGLPGFALLRPVSPSFAGFHEQDIARCRASESGIARCMHGADLRYLLRVRMTMTPFPPRSPYMLLPFRTSTDFTS